MRDDPPGDLRREWGRTCAGLGAADEDAIEGGWIVIESLYAQPPRAYHNLGHVADCLATCLRMASIPVTSARPEIIRLAIFAHDCVYDSRRDDNEARSARVARLLARGLGLTDAQCTQVATLVLATTHKGEPHSDAEAFIRDVDLVSLAATPEEFDANTRTIRQEYRWATDEQWRQGRSAFFRDMLARPAIYALREFREAYERAARDNLGRALRALGA